MIQYKEQIVDHVLLNSSYRLHYNDRKFFKNIQSIIKDAGSITDGQAALFDKLIIKYYQTTLKSTGQTIDQLVALQWKKPPLALDPSFMVASVSLTEDNTLILKCPFKSKFVNKFSRIRDNGFSWDKHTKQYKAKYSVYQLKILTIILPEYFENVKYCDRLTQLIEPLKQYSSNLTWEPTLKKINDYYFIAATNEIIADLLKDVSLDNSPHTLHKLGMMGIKVDSDIINDPCLEFASKNIVECDISEVTTIFGWLKDLGIKYAINGSGINTMSHQKIYTNHIITSLLTNKITLLENTDGTLNPAEIVLLQQYGDNKKQYYGKYAISKSIYIKNSYTIEVK